MPTISSREGAADMDEDDDLGTFLTQLGDHPGGRVPFIDEEEFASLMEGWRVVARGNRPHDHVGRDLLFGSPRRDHRVGWYHRLRRKPPAWVNAAFTETFEVRDVDVPQSLFVNHLLLRSLHVRHLAILAVDD